MSPAHLSAGTWLEGMARCLVAVMESSRLFFFFLITLLCDKSYKVKEKYKKLLFFFNIPDLLIAYVF